MTKTEAVNLIWDYMLVGHELKPADVILVLGSNDDRVASYAFKLFHQGLAPWLVISGDGTQHKTDLLRDAFDGQTEAEHFAEIVIKAGLPKDKIILETKANNTGENFSFSRPLIEKAGVNMKSAIVVQKPYMERRALATGEAQWPDIKLIVTSPPFATFNEYIKDKFDPEEIINIMLGDLQRIKEYPKRGFQTEQEIPINIHEAYEYLVSSGYTQHLLK